MERRRCFVISPIGSVGSQERTRADQLLRHVVRPAMDECSYETIRADELGQPGIITSQIITHLVEDELVIADLTGPNANVFYELAIRHMARKPVIQLIDDVRRVPFDLAATRTIPVDYRDLDSVSAARVEIIRQIHTIEDSDASAENPITVAIDLRALTISGSPIAAVSAEVISLLTEIRAMMTREPLPAVPNGQSLRLLASDLTVATDLLAALDATRGISVPTLDQIWYSLTQAEARIREVAQAVGVQIVPAVAAANAARIRTRTIK